LSGDYGAISDTTFFVAGHVLSRSLVPIGRFDAGSTPGGITSFGPMPARIRSTSSSGHGNVEYLDLERSAIVGRAATLDAPLTADRPARWTAQIGEVYLPFTRSIAALSDRRTLVSLSTAGFMTLPVEFDAPMARPAVSAVVNAADGSSNVAPGTRIRIEGGGFSSTTEMNEEIPASDSLGGVCVLVDNKSIPLLRVSPTQVDAQLPFSVAPGTTTLSVRTGGGIGEPFRLDVQNTPSAVF
jgi:hypothetical protein